MRAIPCEHSLLGCDLCRRAKAALKQKVYRKTHPDAVFAAKNNAFFPPEVSIATLRTSETCPICFLPFSDTVSAEQRVTDHDHTTRMVRDDIHRRCNSMLGMAMDTPWILRNAARFVEQYRRKAAELGLSGGLPSHATIDEQPRESCETLGN